MWRIGKSENRVCPQHFQDRLTRVGGVNRYGDPNFTIEWGMTHTVLRGWDYGYREILDNFNAPAWVLYEWHPPEEYGSQEIYYMQNRDEITGLQALGEYPHRGRYEIVNPFKHKAFVNGKLVITYMELNNTIIDLIVPLLIQAQHTSIAAKQAALKEVQARKRQGEIDQIADRLQDAMPAYTEPVSFSRQGCRTSLIDKKIEEIQRGWNIAMKRARQLPRGLSTSKYY